MSTLIVYATMHGCTAKAAEMLKSKLDDEAILSDIKQNSKPDLSSFDTIIIGASIHAGTVQGKIKKFCRNNLGILEQKRLGLYLCCMHEGEPAQQQFNIAYPQELRDHAVASGLFGGEFDFDKMNFLQKAIVKKVAGVTASVSNIKEDEIARFAAVLNKK